MSESEASRQEADAAIAQWEADRARRYKEEQMFLIEEWKRQQAEEQDET